MAPQQKERLRALTAEEQATLERVRQASERAARRGAAGDGAAGGGRRGELRGGGAGGGLCRAAARCTRWSQRFNARGLAALAIAPGRGPKADLRRGDAGAGRGAGPAAAGPQAATARRPGR